MKSSNVTLSNQNTVYRLKLKAKFPSTASYIEHLTLREYIKNKKYKKRNKKEIKKIHKNAWKYYY
tara:strand:+ start:2405 stop:2599 length:195 start_codon:yes stop_codon:yes gene_type:complete